MERDDESAELVRGLGLFDSTFLLILETPPALTFVGHFEVHEHDNELGCRHHVGHGKFHRVRSSSLHARNHGNDFGGHGVLEGNLHADRRRHLVGFEVSESTEGSGRALGDELL